MRMKDKANESRYLDIFTDSRVRLTSTKLKKLYSLS